MSDGGIQYWQTVGQWARDAGLIEAHRAWKDQFFNEQESEVPNINDMVQSKYLKQADIPDPVIVTVQGVKQVNMAKDDEAPEMKWCIKFVEFQKPMALNSTNIHVAAKVFGSNNTDDWKGKEIILFTDPNVSFGGQVVGGLRFRGQEKAPVKAAGSVRPDLDDDIPF